VKRCLLRPRARQDRRDEVRYYRIEAGASAAEKLVGALEVALDQLQRQPDIEAALARSKRHGGKACRDAQAPPSPPPAAVPTTRRRCPTTRSCAVCWH
jgi:hypothetical protein